MKIREGDIVVHKETQAEGRVRRINWSGQAEVEWFLCFEKNRMYLLEELEPRDFYNELRDKVIETTEMSLGKRLKYAWRVLKRKVAILED
jgi:hypothetical protein